MSDPVQPHRRQPTRLPRPWDSPGKNTGVGCHCLLHRIQNYPASNVNYVEVGNHTLPVVPNIFSTRDWFCERHFCHAPGQSGDGLGMVQVCYIYGALYFYYYCISSTSDHQSLDRGGWDPCLRWKWLHLLPSHWLEERCNGVPCWTTCAKVANQGV